MLNVLIASLRSTISYRFDKAIVYQEKLINKSKSRDKLTPVFLALLCKNKGGKRPCAVGTVDCEQSLIFLCKVTARETRARELRAAKLRATINDGVSLRRKNKSPSFLA